ncbi:MAG: hypothetical protein HYX72_07035 [Acidobacteria bacterium]|nr:hypothetical protein [Acidobacteriota bacterium]
MPKPSPKRLRCAASRTKILLWTAVLLASAAPAISVGEAQSSAPILQNAPQRRPAISRAEFSEMVRLFAEEEGSFFSDNFVSNETGYLHVIGKLKRLGVSGGAYVGVGPEQNFTYISKIRPEIAFIVDIRRGAIIQHLMYKAIFELAPDRSRFLSLLFSKPLEGKFVPGRDASAGELVQYFTTTPSQDDLFNQNLATIRKTIEKGFDISLSPHDEQLLNRVYNAFREANLRISTRWSSGAWYGGFPTLKDLFLATDLSGKNGNFIATHADYQFLRNMHKNNRIVPVVGDFAGKKALAVVGHYLKENGYTVSAFYTSNVEQYLFGDQVFDNFAENVRRLPINEKSVFIRAARGGRRYRNFRMTTVLQKISVFLKDFDEGAYTDYGALVTTHHIFGDEP